MNTNILNCHIQNSPKIPSRLSIAKAAPTPARDRVIDFGKHKGKPLGALPSIYLKWVSRTLRARDSQQWAHLADQVLQDPIYRDRIEWEFADNVLRGNNNRLGTGGAVAELLEISERFGWDNDDKDAWKRVDFQLLGTSRGGRIPRRTEKGEEKGAEKRRVGEGIGGKRRERRERRERVRREVEGCLGDIESGNEVQTEGKEKDKGKVYNPFPGREGLLKEVLRGRRFL